jgi:hypothetical protein
MRFERGKERGRRRRKEDESTSNRKVKIAQK